MRRWLPDLAQLPARWIHHPAEAPPPARALAGVVLGATYPHPIVDHLRQRDLATAMYVEALGPEGSIAATASRTLRR